MGVRRRWASHRAPVLRRPGLLGGRAGARTHTHTHTHTHTRTHTHTPVLLRPGLLGVHAREAYHKHEPLPHARARRRIRRARVKYRRDSAPLDRPAVTSAVRGRRTSGSTTDCSKTVGQKEKLRKASRCGARRTPPTHSLGSVARMLRIASVRPLTNGFQRLTLTSPVCAWIGTWEHARSVPRVGSACIRTVHSGARRLQQPSSRANAHIHTQARMGTRARTPIGASQRSKGSPYGLRSHRTCPRLPAAHAWPCNLLKPYRVHVLQGGVQS
jgi:hypothetical protein